MMTCCVSWLPSWAPNWLGAEDPACGVHGIDIAIVFEDVRGVAVSDEQHWGLVHARAP